MAFTSSIARKMGMSQNIVNNIAKKIDVRGDYNGNLSYEIKDQDVPKLKTAIRKESLKFIKRIAKNDEQSEKTFIIERIQEYILAFNIADLVEIKDNKVIFKEQEIFSQESSTLSEKDIKINNLQTQILAKEKQAIKLRNLYLAKMKNILIKIKDKKLAQLQAKLDLIEQEKKETAEIVERIKEKFFK